MGPQYPVLLLAAILLIPATCRAGRHQRFNKTGKFRPGARSGLADSKPNDPVCRIATQDDYFGPYFETVVCSNPTDLCGIDKAKGEVQGCVPASECPAGTGKTLSCDPGKPSCCCRSTYAEWENREVLCNDVWERDDTSKCKQACSLPELKNFDFCKIKLSDVVYCAYEFESGDSYEYDYIWCFANQYCGIDRTTGKLQGCVNDTVCPASAKGSKIVACDSTKASCCCQEITPGTVDRPDEAVECNHIKNSEDSRVWQQACKLPELSSLPVCKVNPTKKVNCMYKDDWHNEIKTEECKAWELCGIAKKDGEMHKCLDASQCPAKAFGSKKIVCDGSSPNCCCQKESNPGDNTRPCNDLVNDRDSTIWQQACSLSELKTLDICKEDPSKRLSCTKGSYVNSVYSGACKTTEMCGIDKKDGEMLLCVDPSKCPASAKGSEKIICDDKAPFCCCQNLEGKHDSTKRLPCNSILADDDDTIWKYGCSLAQLKNTPPCQANPTLAVNCDYQYGGPSGGASDQRCWADKLCGIDKSTGELQKCLEPSECPASAKNSDKIVCDPGAKYCCCQTVKKWRDEAVSCNNLLNKTDNKKWQETCKIKELSSLPICQEDPTKTVVCTAPADDEVRCKPSEFCGIDKTDGEMVNCLDATECPASAKGSERIVCDASAPNCCCQKVELRESKEKHPCNFITNKKDSTIWQQACSLPELSGLDVCIDDPSKKIYCSYINDWDDLTSTECRPSEFCGINKTSGELRACIDRTECPAGAKGSAKVVCDANAPFCCCQKLQAKDDDDDKLPCNNILTWKDTSVWEQACKLPELKPLEVCKTKPTKPTTPPPPTAPPTPTPPPTTPGPVKPEDMDSECLNFCKDEKPDDHPYLFRVYCGEAKAENTCPSPCPSACGKFCWDGRHMECPPFGGGPPPPPPRESGPSRGTDYVDLDYRSKEFEAGFYAAFTIISLLVLLIFAGCIYLCCMSSGTVVAPLPFAAIQQQRQAMAFNSSTAATSSGTSLSSSESSLSSIAIKR